MIAFSILVNRLHEVLILYLETLEERLKSANGSPTIRGQNRRKHNIYPDSLMNCPHYATDIFQA